jgi:hypothetical protein
MVSQRCELCNEHGEPHFEQFLVNLVTNQEISNILAYILLKQLSHFWAILYIKKVYWLEAN